MRHINLIGVGIKGFKQVTLEAIEAIQASHKVYHLTLFHNELSALNANTSNLTPLYTSSESSNVYEIITKQIIDAANEGEIVSFVVYGHPLFLVDSSISIIEAARQKEITVKVIPGISSIDAIWTLFARDPGREGIQIIEANALMKPGIMIDKNLDVYITQVTEYKLPFNRYLKVKDYPDGISEITNKLLTIYPKDHEVSLIACSPVLNHNDLVYITNLEELPGKTDIMIRGMTMYIPKVASN